MSNRSRVEEAFAFWLTAHELRDLPKPVREFYFAKPRRWRFDFAWPGHKVAVEIEGLLWSGGGGRHQRAKGFVEDCEKYEAALRLGWTVYRVPASWVLKGGRYVFRPEVMETLRMLLLDTVPSASP